MLAHAPRVSHATARVQPAITQRQAIARQASRRGARNNKKFEPLDQTKDLAQKFEPLDQIKDLAQTQNTPTENKALNPTRVRAFRASETPREFGLFFSGL
jgi:hypothetical protein